MPAPPRVLAVLGALSLLAGCIGEDAPGAEPAAAATPASTPPTSPDALANATGTGGAPLAPVVADASYSGETGTWACVFSPTLPMPVCEGEFSASATKELPYEGTPLRLTGTLTWNETAPTGQPMQVSILTKVDGEFSFNSTSPTSVGTSPLAFDFDLAPFAGLEIAVDVASVHGQDLPDGGFAGGSAAQAFTVVASLVYQPAP